MPRIALQGGGARLADLLAAASAIYKSGIGCNAYAGTSAGSIAAAILAAGADPRILRDHFVENRADLEALVPKSGRVALLRHAYRVGVQGKPLIDLESLRNVLSRAFDALGIKQNIKIGQLDQPLFIIAANIRDKQPEIYQGDDNLLDSIARSCAIPVVFTAATTHDRHVVDGGVFNNLPVDVLLDMPGDPEEVIAVAFKDDFKFDPKNALQYVSDIFSSMIDSRVQDSVVRVGEDNVFEIETRISSFSVADFFDGLSEPRFAAREAEASRWLNSWVSKDRVQFKDLRGLHRHPVHYSRYLCGKVGELESLYASDPSPSFDLVDILIKPSINEEDDGYDALISEATLLAHGDRAQHTNTCQTVTPTSSLQLITADWQVTDDKGRTVPHVAFPLISPGNPRIKVVLFFGEPLRAKCDGGRAYVIRQRQIIKGLMGNLPKGADWFGLNLLPEETMKRLRIRLATRRGWGGYRQEPTDGTPGKPIASRQWDDVERTVIAWQASNLKGGERLRINYSRV